MRKIRTNRFYVKAFKITNSEGDFTEKDFINLIEKFKIIRKLYFDENYNCDCYSNFRTITKEIKRAAHNAGLKAELLDVKYDTSDSEIIIKGDNVAFINLTVYIKPVTFKKDSFTVADIQLASYAKGLLSVSNNTDYEQIPAFICRKSDFNYANKYIH